MLDTTPTGGATAHIEAKHADVVQRIPQIIRDGEVTQVPENPGRVYISDGTRRAVVRLDWEGMEKKWLVTAYEEAPRPERTTDQARTEGGGRTPSPRGELKENFVPQSENVNPETLFQTAETDPHIEAVRQAVESGLPVPDEVLEGYRTIEWASEELEAREAIKADARGFDDPDEFVRYQTTMTLDDGHGADYYRYLWQRAQGTQSPLRIANRRFVDALTKPALETVLGEMAVRGQLAGMHNLMQAAAKGMRSGKHLSAAGYKKIMDQIRARPTYYRELFAVATKDVEGFNELQRERELDPDGDLTERQRDDIYRHKKSVEAKTATVDELSTQLSLTRVQVENLQAKLSTTQKEAKQELKSTSRALREKYREEKKRLARAQSLVRAIMRPPSKSMNYDEAATILAMQANVIVRAPKAERAAWRKLVDYMKANPETKLDPEARSLLTRFYIQEATIEELEEEKKAIQHFRTQGSLVRDFKVPTRRALINAAVRAGVDTVGGGKLIEEVRELGSKFQSTRPRGARH